MANEQAWAAQLNGNRQQTATQNKKNKLASMVEEKLEEVAQKPSQAALKYCWVSTVPSYGLSLLYVIFHFVIKYLPNPLSRFFCKMGEEGMFGVTPPPPKEVPGAEKGAELAEIIVVLALIGVLAIIFFLCIVQIGFIAWTISNVAEATALLGGALVNQIAGGSS